MSRVIDITGQTFGKLTVIKRVKNNKENRAMWLCQCECGNQKVILGKTLRNGKSQSCGCSQRKQLFNQRFGKLVAIKPTDRRDGVGSIIWECKCDCGNTCFVSARCLVGGNTSSCGCIKSRGEYKIQQLLEKNEIFFIKEYSRQEWKFPDTNYVGRFDFYLPDYNILIEYDGSYHYEEKEKREGNLSKYQDHDRIKNQWAQEANIKLIRIPYWESDSITLDKLLGN